MNTDENTPQSEPSQFLKELALFKQTNDELYDVLTQNAALFGGWHAHISGLGLSLVQLHPPYELKPEEVTAQAKNIARNFGHDWCRERQSASYSYRGLFDLPCGLRVQLILYRAETFTSEPLDLGGM